MKSSDVKFFILVSVKADSSCRNILWCLVFCGFAVNYMHRANLNLAIVAMVRPHENRVAASQCTNVDQLSPRNVLLSNRSSILSNTSENFHRNSSVIKYNVSTNVIKSNIVMICYRLVRYRAPIFK